jgi:hypothetical protein
MSLSLQTRGKNQKAKKHCQPHTKFNYLSNREIIYMERIWK